MAVEDTPDAADSTEVTVAGPSSGPYHNYYDFLTSEGHQWSIIILRCSLHPNPNSLKLLHFSKLDYPDVRRGSAASMAFKKSKGNAKRYADARTCLETAIRLDVLETSAVPHAILSELNLPNMAGAGAANGLGPGAMAMPGGHVASVAGIGHVGGSIGASTAAPSALTPALTAVAAAGVNAGGINAGRLVAGAPNVAGIEGVVQPKPEPEPAGDDVELWSEEDGDPGAFGDEDDTAAAAMAAGPHALATSHPVPRPNQRRSVVGVGGKTSRAGAIAPAPANPSPYRGARAGGNGGGGIGIGRGHSPGAPASPPGFGQSTAMSAHKQHLYLASAAASPRIGCNGFFAEGTGETGGMGMGMGVGTGGGGKGGSTGGADSAMQPFGTPIGAPHANVKIGGYSTSTSRAASARGKVSTTGAGLAGKNNGGANVGAYANDGSGGGGFCISAKDFSRGAVGGLKSPSLDLNVHHDQHGLGDALTQHPSTPPNNGYAPWGTPASRGKGRRDHRRYYRKPPFSPSAAATASSECASLGTIFQQGEKYYCRNSDGVLVELPLLLDKSDPTRKYLLHDNKVIDIAQHFDTEGQHLHYGDDNPRYSSGGGHPGGPGFPKDDRDPHYGGDGAGTLAQRRFFSPEHGHGPTVIPPSTPASSFSYHPSPIVQRRLQALERELWEEAEARRNQAKRQEEENQKVFDEQRAQREGQRKQDEMWKKQDEMWKKQDGQNAKTDDAIADLQDAQKGQNERNAKTDDAIDRVGKLEADFSQFKVQQKEKVTKLERFAEHANKRQNDSDALQTKIVAEVRKNS